MKVPFGTLCTLYILLSQLTLIPISKFIIVALSILQKPSNRIKYFLVPIQLKISKMWPNLSPTRQKWTHYIFQKVIKNQKIPFDTYGTEEFSTFRIVLIVKKIITKTHYCPTKCIPIQTSRKVPICTLQDQFWQMPPHLLPTRQIRLPFRILVRKIPLDKLKNYFVSRTVEISLPSSFKF